MLLCLNDLFPLYHERIRFILNIMHDGEKMLSQTEIIRVIRVNTFSQREKTDDRTRKKKTQIRGLGNKAQFLKKIEILMILKGTKVELYSMKNSICEHQKVC